MTDLVVQNAPPPALFDMKPTDKIREATAIANVLADVIKQQKLFTNIQGKPHVRVEGWQTLGTLLGILPKEIEVIELEDGSYVANVELVSQKTGHVVGGASALCGIEEKRWANADRYARRSMAVTRATGKAYRLAFGWIMAMAGYEVTPAEEMIIPFESRKESYNKIGYDHQNKRMQDALIKVLTEKNIPSDLWDEIGIALIGRPSSDIDKVIEEVKSIFQKE